MATIYQKRKNRIWYISYFFSGRRIYKSLRTTDEKFAQIQKEELEVNLWKGTHRENRRMALETYLGKYLKTITHRRPKKYTRQRRRSIVQHFREILFNKETFDIFRFLIKTCVSYPYLNYQIKAFTFECYNLTSDSNGTIDLSKLLKNYEGKWVILSQDNKSVYGSGKSAKLAAEDAALKGYPDFTLLFVQPFGLLYLMSFILC